MLRQWRDSDVEPYVELCADPEVMRHIGDGKPRGRAQTELSINRMVTAWKQHEVGVFALETVEDGRFIGFCGLASPDFLPEILPVWEIGWRLRRDRWGHGLAAEAAAAVLDWAFDDLELDHVVAVIGSSNERSLRLAAHLGMQLERQTVVPRHQRPVEVHDVRATDWRSE